MGDEATQGSARRRRAQGPKSDQLQQVVATLDPQIAEWVDSFVFGEVWARPGLAEHERMLIAVAVLAATHHPDQLRVYLFGALYAGVPADKIHETLVMLTVYTGFPTALQSLTLWREVLQSARRQDLDLQ